VNALNTLSEFIAALESAGELVRVRQPVSVDLELCEISDRAMKQPGGGPALLFEHVTLFDGSRSAYPVAINLFGSMKRMEISMGVQSLDEIGARITELLQTKVPEGLMGKLSMLPRLLELGKFPPRKRSGTPPCQEVIWRGNDIDLGKLPIIKCWPEDGGAYITLPMVISRDPSKGIRNVGMYRVQVLDRNSLAMHWQRHKVGAAHWREMAERGETMPVVIAIGADPPSMYSASAPLPPTIDPRLGASLLMRALRREPVERTPIWLMRQAGRYLASYRAVRARVPLLELCKRPELVCEVTVDAVHQLGVDAGIVFSDLLIPLEAMGAPVEFVPGAGPVIAHPLRESEDLERFGDLPPGALGFVAEGVRLARAALPGDVPLLGFAGAPFTLASYLIEGGTSRTYEHTKLVMYRDEGRWHLLLERLARAMGAFLGEQIAAGAQAVQVFDTAAGCLAPADYRRFVLPHTRTLLATVRAAAPGAPVILFATAAAGLLSAMREVGADAIGVDWRIELDDAWRAIGYDTAVQGNLDPALLFAAAAEIRRAAAAVLARAAGRPGHVFNLGHGILPRTPLDGVKVLIDAVRDFHPAKETR
jgi:uroporphyrinogen decarboxylase